MKFIFVIFLCTSLLAEPTETMLLKDEIQEIFKIESFELEGNDESGLIQSGGIYVGTYSKVMSKLPYSPSLPDLKNIRRIEYRDNFEPYNVQWTSESSEDFKRLYAILMNHSTIEVEHIAFTNLKDGSVVRPEITSGRWCGCTDGLYITDRDGVAHAIVGEIGQSEFEAVDEQSKDFDNLALGLYLKKLINSKEPDSPHNSGKRSAPTSI